MSGEHKTGIYLYLNVFLSRSLAFSRQARGCNRCRLTCRDSTPHLKHCASQNNIRIYFRSYGFLLRVRFPPSIYRAAMVRKERQYRVFATCVLTSKSCQAIVNALNSILTLSRAATATQIRTFCSKFTCDNQTSTDSYAQTIFNSQAKSREWLVVLKLYVTREPQIPLLPFVAAYSRCGAHFDAL